MPQEQEQEPQLKRGWPREPIVSDPRDAIAFSNIDKMIPSIIRRAAQKSVPYIHTNPYKAQRLWPPDFAKISQKHQFRLERKYRRRAKLKWARPRWTKFVKLAQLGSIVVIAVYGVLFMDWQNHDNSDHKPFHSIRSWFFGLTGSMWTKDQVRKRDPEDVPVRRTSS